MIDAQSMENIENIDKHLKLAPLPPAGENVSKAVFET